MFLRGALETILVVDDDDSVRKVVVAILRIKTSASFLLTEAQAL